MNLKVKIHGFCSSFKVKGSIFNFLVWERVLKKGLVDGSKDASLEGFSFKDKLKKLAFLFIEKTYF